MAVIRPFRAVLPAHLPGEDVSERTAPPYDVIDPEQRDALLARSDHNVVALELPEGPLDPDLPGNRYETGAARWGKWLDSGTLVRDESEAFYALEQRFSLGDREIRRRTFVAAVDLEPYSAGVVIPHERTLPKAFDDRLHLTRATAANLSQIFALYSDPEKLSDAIFDQASAGDPLLCAVDDDGVASTVWALRDPHAVKELTSIVADKQVFIADGHHRYSTALAYRDERRGTERSGGWRAFDGVMMALANMDDPNLVVLSAHRVADAEGPFDPKAFWSALATDFDVMDVRSPDPLAELTASDGTAFLVRTVADGAVRLARLKASVDLDEAVDVKASTEWKHLDVTVLQELILEPLLGIHPDRPDTLDRLSFVSEPERALTLDDHDTVFLHRPTRMEQLRAVTLNGEIMPQKSTYFYPKLLSGLLMRSLED